MNNSPISNLIDVLIRVKKDSIRYRDQLIHNEAQTRLTLIDPVIQCLGWNLANPTMVRVELPHNQVRIDYGLIDSDEHMKVIIEAKTLGTQLNHFAIINIPIQYAFANGVPNVVLTDGINWHFYNDFQPGHTIPETFNLSEPPLHELALALISKLDVARFGYAELPEGNAVQDVEPVVAVQPPQLVVPRVIQQNGVFVTIDQLEPELAHHPAPRALRLPDGNIVQVHAWSNVLLELTKYVLDKNVNIQLPLHDQAGGNVYLVSTNRPTSRHEVYQYAGRTVFIHINYSSTNCIKNSKYIWEKLPAAMRGNIPALRFD